MPTTRIVSLLIRASNLTGSALNAASRDIEGLTGPMAKVGEYAKKILDVKWVSQLLNFLKSMRYAWLAIVAVLGGAIATIVNKIREYQANLKSAGDVMYAFKGSGESLAGTFKNISEAAKSAGVKFSEMASFMEESGERFNQFGLTTGKITMALEALKTSGMSGKTAMKTYADITIGLQGALEKILPPLEKQEDAMKRLGISADLLKKVLGGDISSMKELRDKIVNVDDAMAIMADRTIGQKLIPHLEALTMNLDKVVIKAIEALGLTGKLTVAGIPPISPEIGESGIAATKTFSQMAEAAREAKIIGKEDIRGTITIDKENLLIQKGFAEVRDSQGKLIDAVRSYTVTLIDELGRYTEVVAGSIDELQKKATAISEASRRAIARIKAETDINRTKGMAQMGMPGE